MFKDGDNDRQIFRSKSALTTDSIPEQLPSRSEEIDRISNAVRPLMRGDTPGNLLVYGPTGVGKTTCVKHVFQRLEEETRAKAVCINCWQYNTRPSLLTELLIQLGYPAPRKGKPVDELLAKLREWLDKNQGVAVALDEFDQLEEDAEVVYDLQLLNRESENPVATVPVSNQHPRSLELDPRSKSRLSMQTLQFHPYTAPQLENILQKRVEQAFRPGAVDDEVIETIAEQTAENSGDARQALNSLLRAGRKAEDNNKSSVTVDTLPDEK